MVSSLYWIMCIVFNIVLVILMYQSKRYPSNNPKVDKTYRWLIAWCMFYTTCDALWGLVAGPLFPNKWVIYFFTKVMYLLSTATSFFWLKYINVYLKRIKKLRIYYALLGVVFLLQCALMVANDFTRIIYDISDSCEFITGTYRHIAITNNYILFLVATIISFVYWRRQKNISLRKKYFAVTMFCLSPTIAGLLQLFEASIPYFTIGFFIAICVVEAYIRTKDHDEELLSSSNTDGLTAFYNRKVYEDDLNYLIETPSDLVVIQMDVNRLKMVNDKFGHSAGDDLIKGAALCAKEAFGGFGKLYRTGGDELVALVRMSPETLENQIVDFRMKCQTWSSIHPFELSVSIGTASKYDFTHSSIFELSTIADKRMYDDKDRFYSESGLDTHLTMEAYSVMCKEYQKIVRFYLDRRDFDPIRISPSDQNYLRTNHITFFDILKKTTEDGYIHPDDVEEFKKISTPQGLEYCLGDNSTYGFLYRKKENDKYINVVIEFVKSDNYSETNKEVFMYLKIAGDKK